jgi:hypothetical protein
MSPADRNALLREGLYNVKRTCCTCKTHGYLITLKSNKTKEPTPRLSCGCGHPPCPECKYKFDHNALEQVPCNGKPYPVDDPAEYDWHTWVCHECGRPANKVPQTTKLQLAALGGQEKARGKWEVTFLGSECSNDMCCSHKACPLCVCFIKNKLYDIEAQLEGRPTTPPTGRRRSSIKALTDAVKNVITKEGLAKIKARAEEIALWKAGKKVGLVKTLDAIGPLTSPLKAGEEALIKKSLYVIGSPQDKEFNHKSQLLKAVVNRSQISLHARCQSSPPSSKSSRFSMFSQKSPDAPVVLDCRPTIDSDESCFFPDRFPYSLAFNRLGRSFPEVEGMAHSEDSAPASTQQAKKERRYSTLAPIKIQAPPKHCHKRVSPTSKARNIRRLKAYMADRHAEFENEQLPASYIRKEFQAFDSVTSLGAAEEAEPVEAAARSSQDSDVGKEIPLVRSPTTRKPID